MTYTLNGKQFKAKQDQRQLLLLVASRTSLVASQERNGVGMTYVIDKDPNEIGNGDVCIRTDKGALVALVYAKNPPREPMDIAHVIAGALNAAFCPSMTDLMVDPASLDRFMAENPLTNIAREVENARIEGRIEAYEDLANQHEEDANEYNRLRDPGMANHQRKYARAFRAKADALRALILEGSK